MNPIDHPHGGGEGKKSKKSNPMSIWGKPNIKRWKKKKGKFIVPIIYKLLKKGVKVFNFKNKPFLNIRSTDYFKKFNECLFNVHTGRKFVNNDIKQLNKIFKEYPFYNFKLGQISYNRVLIERNRIKIPYTILIDLKKKKKCRRKIEKKKKKITFQKVR